MNAHQEQHAKDLFFQTELGISQIAAVLGLDRSTLHNYIMAKNWKRLRQNAQNIPSIVVEHCYLIAGQLTRSILSEGREHKPMTREEAGILHKLTICITRLKKRATVNENMETFAHFMQLVHAKSPAMATELQPIVDEFIRQPAGIYLEDVKPTGAGDSTRFPAQPADNTEARLDTADLMAWGAAADPLHILTPGGFAEGVPAPGAAAPAPAEGVPAPALFPAPGAAVPAPALFPAPGAAAPAFDPEFLAVLERHGLTADFFAACARSVEPPNPASLAA